VTSSLVSVVICAYNNWPDLEMTIESALHQSYRSIEVIVVDNSSIDETAVEVPRRFGSAVKYIRQPNRMDAGAYNMGLSMARGEFIQLVDGDDVLAPNKIAKQIELFETNPELDIVYGDIRRFQTSGGVARWKDLATKPEDDILHAFIGPNGEQWPAINVLGVLFRRRALERVGPWDETLYISDLDYWMRADYLGCRFGHCPGVMGFYRVHPGQMTSNRSALERGQEEVWSKTFGYVDREPYRSLIAAKLARVRYYRAVSLDIPRRQALAQLKQARRTSPNTITPLVYMIGVLCIHSPGGAAFMRSNWLTPIRRVFGKLLGYARIPSLDDEPVALDTKREAR
jgi:glycosyltransferase involved in cell wall biosynthesis